jgi:hypothetical protein
LADKKVVDFKSPVAGLRRKSRAVERIPGNSFERKYGCKIAAIVLSNTSFTQTGNYGLHDVDEKKSCLSLSSTA